MNSEIQKPDTLQADSRSEAGRTAQQEARKLQAEAVQEARSLKDQAVEEAQSRAEGAKDTVADEVSSVGKAFRTAFGELRDGSPQEQLFSTMADGLADFADSVRGRSVSELVNGIGEFGRRNPAAFLGGAALLGFAAVRAARASQRDHAASPARHGAAGSSHTAGQPGMSAARPAHVHRDEDM